MLTPIRITEFATGIQATFADGATTDLVTDGARCTCLGRAGTPCPHIRAALPFYERRKWLIAEENRARWGRSLFERMGIDGRIFCPPPFTRWGGDDMARIPVRGGQLFIFRDGAFLAVIPAHPEGGTKCSQCGTRSCAHWADAREWLADPDELQQAGVRA